MPSLYKASQAHSRAAGNLAPSASSQATDPTVTAATTGRLVDLSVWLACGVYSVPLTVAGIDLSACLLRRVYSHR